MALSQTMRFFLTSTCSYIKYSNNNMIFFHSNIFKIYNHKFFFINFFNEIVDQEDLKYVLGHSFTSALVTASINSFLGCHNEDGL